VSPQAPSPGSTPFDSLGTPVSRTRRSVNGVVLHGVEAGPEDGPLVVLLHGFPEFWWGWRRQIPVLAKAGFRVVAVDQRGYNTSDKPTRVAAYELDRLAGDVAAIIESCGRRRAHVVGHDWGGLVAWWTASRHPDRIERLAILNAPHPAIVGSYMRRHPSQILRSHYVAFFQIPWVPEAMLARSDYAALRGALVGSSRRGTFSQADLERYREAWRQPGALTGMLNWYRALRHRPAMANPRVASPALVIWGVEDRFLDIGLAHRSLALCDSGRLVRIEDATHWVHLEDAERVNGDLVRFLEPPAL
jgi:pimeloyl-ACP methyl ester carboxylesterase